MARQLSDDPIKRFALLLLFQAREDQATELTIAAAGRRDPGPNQVQGQANLV
jgi:hypothetical protein